MFLDDTYSNDYLLSLLNEAPADATGNTATMSNSDNAMYEPTEQNASMNASIDNMDADMGDDSLGGDMGGDMGAGEDASMGGGMDTGMGDQVNTKDLFKKRRLFQNYKDLLEVIDKLLEVTIKMYAADMSKDGKKLFRFINKKMEDNKEKINIILSEQFFSLSYQQLLTIYMYIKMATKLYSDMCKQLHDLYCLKEKE